MNNKILMSVKPSFVKEILKGYKKYEYRIRIPQYEFHSFIMYAISPIKKAVAEVEVLEVLTMDALSLWELTKEDSGMSRKAFFKYFEGIKDCHAFKLGKITLFDKPKSLEDYGLKYAPQSFTYIDEKYY